MSVQLIYFRALIIGFVQTYGVEYEDSIKCYEVMLKKLNDEIKQEEIIKRDKIRLLEYLHQATKDRQVCIFFF